jgi:hypothetical protein
LSRSISLKAMRCTSRRSSITLVWLMSIPSIVPSPGYKRGRSTALPVPGRLLGHSWRLD